MTARTTPQADGTPVWRDFWTTDPESVGTLLTGLFGCTIAQVGPEPGYSVAELPQGALCGIGPATPEEAPKDVACLFLAAADVRAVHARALELGAREAIGPMEVGPTGSFSTVVDPTGAIVSLWQAGEQVGYAAVDEPGFPCWQSLHTTDVDAACAFYGDLFGFTWEDGPSEGSKVAMRGEDALFDVAPAGDCGMSVWFQYQMVEDLEASLTRAKELGCTEGDRVQAPFGTWVDLETDGGAFIGLVQMGGPQG